MIIHDVIQGSDEWLRVRAGIPTASAFDKIITPKGRPSESQEAYMYTLLAERFMGHPVKDHVSLWMERGKEVEAEAIAYYRFMRDLDEDQMQRIGFVTNDEGTIGASPDHFVGEDGCLEIKIPKEYIHMMYLLFSGSHYEKYKIQCQGQLWLTQRKFVDIMSYHPELPEALGRIERDEGFIALLADEVTSFSRRLESKYLEIIEKGIIPPPRPKETTRAGGVIIPKLGSLEDLVKSAKEALLKSQQQGEQN